MHSQIFIVHSKCVVNYFFCKGISGPPKKAKCCQVLPELLAPLRTRTSCGYLSTVDFPIGGHVNVLSDYEETGPEKKLNTVTAVMSLIC